MPDPPKTGVFLGSPAYVPRTPWTPTAAVLATVVIVSASVVGSVLLLGPGTVADAPNAAPGRWMPADRETVALATLAVWQAVTIILTIGASAFFGGHVRDVLAMRAPAPSSRAYLQAILLMVLLQVVVSIVQRTLMDDMFSDLRPMARLLAGEQWLLALVVVGIGAPLSEELLFRGFLLSALARSRLGFAGAAVVTSAAWTALHVGYSAAGIIEVFVIGLFFSWLLWRTGSLRVAIFCHALYNSLVVLLLRHVPLPT